MSNEVYVHLHAIETNSVDWQTPNIDDYFLKVDTSIIKTKEDLLGVLTDGLLKQAGVKDFGFYDYDNDKEFDEPIFFARDLADIDPDYLKEHGIELIPTQKINVDWDRGFIL
jgi:hypothetical protein